MGVQKLHSESKHKWSRGLEEHRDSSWCASRSPLLDEEETNEMNENFCMKVKARIWP